MFRPLRRSKQALLPDECERILYEGKTGTLALNGDGGYPYALPINYVYAGGKLYFHCAKSGHKTDAIASSDKASFCVVGRDDVIPEKFTTQYRSVVVFGRIRIMEEREIRPAVRALARKYCPEESDERIEREIGRFMPSLCMLELAPEHISGKQSAGLTEG